MDDDTDKGADAQPRDTRLDHVHAMVQATSFEQHALWCMHARESTLVDTRRLFRRLSWEQDACGFIRQIGEIDGHPVVASVFFAIIRDLPICFYDSTGLYVDWGQVESWARAICPIHTDAQNFDAKLAEDRS